MAHRTSRSKLAAYSQFERLRAQHIEEYGYISCTTAMRVASETLARGEAEIALMFCDLSRALLEESETYLRSAAGVKNSEPQAA